MHSSMKETIVREPNIAHDGQGDFDESIVDGVLSGLIRQDDSADERFVLRLISNQPRSTMGSAIREEIRESESFDISVAFIDENALKSMYQAFVEHADKSGRHNRIITSTKEYFNKPGAFKELMKLRQYANVEVLIWERPGKASTDEVTTQDQPFHLKGYLFTRRMEEGDRSYYNLYIGSSSLTSFALQNQREWNLRVSSTGEAQLIEQVREELDD